MEATNEPATFADGPGVTVETEIGATPTAIWPFISDPDLLARWSDEFMGATWDGEPGLGATFTGRNQNELFGEWETTSHIVAYDAAHRFAWAVRDPDNPGTQWSFELVPVDGGTVLRFAMRFGPGSSGLTWAIDNDPDNESAIIRDRQASHRTNMTRCIEGIKELAEAART